MTQLINVNCNDLITLRSTIVDNSVQVSNAKNEIIEVLNLIKSQWHGIDADSFIESNTELLNSLVL